MLPFDFITWYISHCETFTKLSHILFHSSKIKEKEMVLSWLPALDWALWTLRGGGATSFCRQIFIFCPSIYAAHGKFVFRKIQTDSGWQILAVKSGKYLRSTQQKTDFCLGTWETTGPSRKCFSAWEPGEAIMATLMRCLFGNIL